MTLGTDLESTPDQIAEPCAFGKFIRDSEYNKELSAAIEKIKNHRLTAGKHNNNGYTVRWLLKILLQNNIANYSKDQITRHIRNDCACRKMSDGPGG